MKETIRNKLTKRILTGVIICTVNDKKYIIKEPSSIQKIIADEIYDESFAEAKNKKVFTKQEMVDYLISRKMWSEEKEFRFNEIPEQVEQLKTQLYTAYKNFKSRDPIRKQLKKIRIEMTALSYERDTFSTTTAEGYSDICRQKYLICCNTFDRNNINIWSDGDYLSKDSVIVDSVMNQYLYALKTNSFIRELSRSEPFVSFWSAGKIESSVFGVPAKDLNDSQLTIVSWAKLYDSISQSPNCPPDEVVQDDDMLDGWLILENRKREQEKSKAMAEKGMSKNSNADEVYYFADNKQDANRIVSLNDSHGKRAIKQREAEVRRAGGELRAEKTTDAQLEMRKMSNEQFKSTTRKR